MKIFRFVKKVFLIGLTILLDLINVSSLNAIPLSCIQMNNQNNVKKYLKLLMLAGIVLYFTLLALKQVNVVVIVIILMIPTQKYVFLML